MMMMMMTTTTMMMNGFYIAVVVLVVVARGPVSGAKKVSGRPVINPIIRSAVIETCLQLERKPDLRSDGRVAAPKVEIHHVGDMIYKAKRTIEVYIGYKRPELDPMDQFLSCTYELGYNRTKFLVPDESPFELLSMGCVL